MRFLGILMGSEVANFTRYFLYLALRASFQLLKSIPERFVMVISGLPLHLGHVLLDQLFVRAPSERRPMRLHENGVDVRDGDNLLCLSSGFDKAARTQVSALP
ncbi:MAG: hypothetical protein ACI9Y1_001073 [Lentisphaeria bacterium]|jgi:hypothetical protein